MPDWITPEWIRIGGLSVCALLIGVYVFCVVTGRFRSEPPPWRDPKLSEEERDKAWIDWQW